MNRLRLEHMKTVMQEVEAKALPLDMRRWGCDTVHCAFGWAAVDPTFRSQGLYLLRHCPTYDGRFGFGAAKTFFDISFNQAAQLFDATAYVPTHSMLTKEYNAAIAAITPQDVIVRIDELLCS